MARYKHIVTVVPCISTPVTGEDTDNAPDIEGAIMANASFCNIPHYVLNDRKNFTAYCLTSLTRGERTLARFMIETKDQIIKHIANPEMNPLVVYVEDQFAEALVKELDNPFTFNPVSYFLADPVDSPEVPMSQRRIAIFKIEGTIPLFLHIYEKGTSQQVA